MRMLDGPRSGQVQHLFRAARAADRRQHINAALRRLALLLPLPLVYGAIALGVVKWSTPSAGVASALGYGFWAMCLVPVAGAASSWLARGPVLRGTFVPAAGSLRPCLAARPFDREGRT